MNPYNSKAVIAKRAKLAEKINKLTSELRDLKKLCIQETSVKLTTVIGQKPTVKTVGKGGILILKNPLSNTGVLNLNVRDKV